MVFVIQGDTAPAPPPEPDEVAGLWAWWDASDTGTITASGANVTQWNDKSGNGWHLTPLSGSPDTGVDTLNSLNTIKFANECFEADGTRTVTDFFHDGTSYHVFAVARFGTGSNPNAAYGLIGNDIGSLDIGFFITYDDRAAQSVNNAIQHTILNGNGFGGNEVCKNVSDNVCTANTWHIIDVAGDANASAAARSGISVDDGTVAANNALSNSTSGSDSTNDLVVGAIGGTVLRLTGNIAELFIYNQAVSVGDRTGLIDYLQAKWAL